RAFEFVRPLDPGRAKLPLAVSVFGRRSFFAALVFSLLQVSIFRSFLFCPPCPTISRPPPIHFRFPCSSWPQSNSSQITLYRGKLNFKRFSGSSRTGVFRGQSLTFVLSLGKGRGERNATRLFVCAKRTES